MTTPTRQSARAREFDHILVRLPARVKQLVSEAAQTDNVSQTAFITSAVLAQLLTRDLERLDYPDNVLAIVRAIDSSSADGFPIFGGMRRADWESAQPFVSILVDCDVIGKPASRTDKEVPDAVLFAMALTKVGQAVWPHISSWINATYSRRPGQPEELPFPRS